MTTPTTAQAFTTLIDAPQLAGLLAGSSNSVVLDASFDLADTAAGERRYADAHIAASRYVHLDRDLSTAKTGTNGRHPLPERAAFARTVAALGIGENTQVVALDAQGGMYAARLWWMLKWLGHDAAAVLDGGLAAWQAAGFTTANGPAPARYDMAAPYLDRPSLVAMLDADAVARRASGQAVLDARAPDRFRGENETLDPVGGHIPDALNRFFRLNLEADGRFKPAATLRVEFEAVLGGRGAKDVIHSCGSGVTACHNLLAMTHAGLAGSVLYPGSWSEWSSDPARAVSRD